MELRLAHGRNDPYEEIDSWGFEGPTLLNVDSMQQMYGETYTVKFLTNDAAHVAQQLTSWESWDSQTLEMCRCGNLIEAHKAGHPRRFYADLLMFHRSALAEVADATTHVRRASRALNDAIHSLQRKF
jgi:regulator of RNase E activity RraA